MTRFRSKGLPYWVMITLILSLAFGLRVFRLEGQHIWGDEAWSITVANWPLGQIVASDAETNPPLYHVLLHFALPLFGETPLGIRYLSVLGGVLTVALVARMGQEVGGRRLALWGGLSAALSPMLVHHAQDARMYAVAVAGAAASLTTFVILMKRQDQGGPMPTWLWAAYIAGSLVGVYSHYYALAVLLAQAVAVAAVSAYRRRWRPLLPWCIAWLSMAFLFLPWILVHAAFLRGKAHGRFEALTLETLSNIGRRTLPAFGGGMTLFADQMVWGWAVVLLAVLGLAGLGLRSRHRWMALLCAAVWGGGLLFAWAVNPIMPFFQERYLLVTMPAFLMGVAAGLESLYRLWKPAVLAGLALVIGVAWVSLGNYYFDPAFRKGSYGQMMEDLTPRARAGDLVLLNNPLQASLYDYHGPEGLSAEMLPRERLLDEEQAAALMAEVTAGEDRVWLVETGNPAEYDPEQRARRWLSRHGSQGFFRAYRGVTLSLFILSGPPEMATTLEANLGDELLLLGYSLEEEQLTAGDSLLLTLFWQAQGPVSEDYTIFTHLTDGSGQIRAQMDSQPVGGTRRTSTWEPGETIIDHYALLLPDDLPPGVYRLQVGAYAWPDMQRLPLLDADGEVVDDKIVLQDVSLE